MFRSRSFQIIRQLSTASNVNAVHRTWSGDKCVNQVTLLGRIGGDPVVRGEASNVLTFSLATNVNIKSKSENEDGERDWKQITQWHDIVVFRPYLRAKLAQYCHRGDRVFVSGRLEYRKYEDENAKLQNKAHVVADEVIIVESRGQEQEQTESNEDQGFIDKGF